MQHTFLKSLLSTSLLTLCLFGCTPQTSGPIVRHDAKSGYTIVTDTIELDANQYISAVHIMNIADVASYHGKYICLYYRQNYTAHIPFLHLGYGYLLLSIAKDGQDVFQMPAPSDSYEWHDETPKIKVLKDTLYCYNSSRAYYWNDSSRQWMETEGKDLEYKYEDESYTIYSEDKGEWGDFTRFHEKQTGFDYLFEASMCTVLKYDGAYYIVGPLQLRKVSDPHKGWEMDDSIGYGRWFQFAPPAGIVYRTKYRSPIDYEFADNHNQDTLFYSGFLRNDQMHLLMRDSANTFIAKYMKGRKGAIDNVLSLGNIPVECNLDLNNQDELTLHFHEDWTKEGILNIAKDTVHIRYIKKHQDSLQYTGIQALEQVLDFVANNIGKATMDDARKLEVKIGGRHDGHILEATMDGNPSYEYLKKTMGENFASAISNPREDNEEEYERIDYYHAIDESDSYCVGYCYQKGTQILTTVYIELYQTRFVTSYNPYIFGRYTRGYEVFASLISKSLSVEPDSKGVWHKGDVTISTYGGKNRFVIRTKQP